MPPFADLLAAPGVVEVCELRSSFGVMAYHGGGLEAMTDVIAGRVAEASGASLYMVVQPDEMSSHVASIKVRSEESAALTAFFGHVRIVVTIHGYGRQGMFSSVLLGGRNRTLAAHIAGTVAPRLAAYDFVTDLDRIPEPLRGLHPDNPVNRAEAAGVQIELPPRIRGASPIWLGWPGDGLVPHTTELIDGLVEALSTWDDESAIAPAAGRQGARRSMRQPSASRW